MLATSDAKRGRFAYFALKLALISMADVVQGRIGFATRLYIR